MKASSQVDGANDEIVRKKKKKSKIITISLQLDGTGPPVDENSLFIDRQRTFYLSRWAMRMMMMMIVKLME